MQKRKVTIEVDIDDEKVNCIEDLEREILAQNIHKHYYKSILKDYKLCWIAYISGDEIHSQLSSGRLVGHDKGKVRNRI